MLQITGSADHGIEGSDDRIMRKALIQGSFQMIRPFGHLNSMKNAKFKDPPTLRDWKVAESPWPLDGTCWTKGPRRRGFSVQ